MAPSSSQPHPITLHFQNLVRVAGETIEGRVDLNLPLARKDGIEHLRIEMRGVIKTCVYSTTQPERHLNTYDVHPVQSTDNTVKLVFCTDRPSL